jgi:hypothetical protein
MPTDNVDRLPADAIPSRARVDPWAWGVRVALLLLVSPALLLVLIVGGLFLFAQFVSRAWGKFLGLSRDDHWARASDHAGSEGLLTKSVVAPRGESSLARDKRPA